jgi:diguanylate cyclase (GGDEF)-like protein/PAS domain S-box-containing protein
MASRIAHLRKPLAISAYSLLALLAVCLAWSHGTAEALNRWFPLLALLIGSMLILHIRQLTRRYQNTQQRFEQLEQNYQLLDASNNTLRDRLRKLTASQRDLQTLLDTIQVGVLIVDGTRWQIRAVNQRAGELFGWDSNDLVGLAAQRLFERDSEYQMCRRLIGQNMPISDCEVLLKRSDGEAIWTMLSMCSLVFNGQRAVGMSVVDISERIAHSEQLSEEKRETERVLQQLQSVQQELLQLATHDDLTGVANRRHFNASAEQALLSAVENKRPLSLIMLDVDYFKKVNDTRGHDAGDAVLKQTLGLCQTLIRQGDLLGRMGGEEFALLLPDCDEITALEIAERIRCQISQHPFHIGDGFLHITLSLGVANWRPDTLPPTLAELLKTADLALYQAKADGRNRTMCAPNLPTGCLFPELE